MIKQIKSKWDEIKLEALEYETKLKTLAERFSDTWKQYLSFCIDNDLEPSDAPEMCHNKLMFNPIPFYDSQLDESLSSNPQRQDDSGISPPVFSPFKHPTDNPSLLEGSDRKEEQDVFRSPLLSTLFLPPTDINSLKPKKCGRGALDRRCKSCPLSPPSAYSLETKPATAGATKRVWLTANRNLSSVQRDKTPDTHSPITKYPRGSGIGRRDKKRVKSTKFLPASHPLMRKRRKYAST